MLRGALLLQLLSTAKSKEADAILLKLASDLKMLLPIAHAVRGRQGRDQRAAEGCDQRD
jgi:hypothetical protein